MQYKFHFLNSSCKKCGIFENHINKNLKYKKIFIDILIPKVSKDFVVVPQSYKYVFR